MRAWIFRQLFSNWIPFKWINGNKTNISRVAFFLFGAIAVAQQVWPELLGPLGDIDAIQATVFSMLGLELGKLHAEDKAKED